MHASDMHPGYDLSGVSPRDLAVLAGIFGDPKAITTNRLNAGDKVKAGGHIAAGGGQLLVQDDGNMVIYNPNGAAVWSSKTQGTGSNLLAMQPDGNLVLYDKNMRPHWRSDTQGHPGAYAYFQEDGNLVVYGPGGDALWSTRTSGWKYHEKGNVFSDVGKAVKSAVKSPYLKAVVGGVAIVFPAVGVPAMAALVATEKAIDAAEQTADAAKKLGAQKLLKATADLAKGGDKDAIRAMATIKQVQTLRAKSAGQPVFSAVRAIAAGKELDGILVAGEKMTSGKYRLMGDGSDVVVLKDGTSVRGNFGRV